MNTNLRRTLLAILAAIAAYVGLWAEIVPRSFYASFPGFGLTWISVDGPFNEHLIRDVGSLYLGLGAASIAAAVSRSAVPGRVVGLAWSLFGILHFGYHVVHPEGSVVDRVGTIVTLGLALLLGVVLALPRRAVDGRNMGRMEIQLSMVGLIVRDMPAALAFYRNLGLDIPATEDEKRFVLHRMGSGVTIFFDTVFARTYDAAHSAPAPGGYGSMLEFYLGDDAAVDAKYAELTALGYNGRMAPQQTFGPYAAMIDDPDGNVALLTSDNALAS